MYTTAVYVVECRVMSNNFFSLSLIDILKLNKFSKQVYFNALSENRNSGNIESLKKQEITSFVADGRKSTEGRSLLL